MTEVKICGVNSAEAADAVAAAGADYMGLVFFPRSPRFVGIGAAAELAGRHVGGPLPVGLFVEPEDALIADVLAAVDLHALQIYADAGRATEIQARFGRPVWHAVGVAGADDLPLAAPGVSRLLLDRKPEPADTRPGGNAQRFDWGVLRGWKAPVPWMLAGGLEPGNVAEAIRVTGAPGVDVSSGVERRRGEKDAGLIAAFVAAVRGMSCP